MYSADDITRFARTNARHPRRVFGIKQADRLGHMYVVGKTGTGKSTLLETLIREDIVRGRGVALIDPHGDLVERVANAVPADRKDDLVYLNVPDPMQPYGYNPLKRVPPQKTALAASGLMEVFKKLWGDAWGVRMEHILRNALLALLEQPNATLPDVLRLLTDKSYRHSALLNVTNEQVRGFWQREFAGYSFRYRAESIAPIQNKVGAFLADSTVRRIVTEPDHEISLRRIMDEQKILLVNLAKGEIGDDSAGLLGGMLVTTIGLAAYSRADMPERDRCPFFLYVDEFQTFTTLAVANMVAELRKFGVGTVLVHQYLDQLPPEVRYAVLGNAGTMISFRLGAKDAAFFAREFEPKISTEELISLPNHEIYVKLLIDGVPSQPFSATTFQPPAMRVA